MADGAASLLTAGSGDKDRINGLHNDLLHQIIANLLFTDAVRTAVLARSWRHLWRTAPLVIDDAHLPEPARATAAVARFLAQQPGPFRVVRLRHCEFTSLDRELPKWPRLLAAKGTQELALFNRPHHYPARLPTDILRCASLQCLSLAFWTFPIELTGDDIMLPHLRMLGLINVGIGELNLDTLLALSPVLHTLTLARTRHTRVRLRTQSLRCLILGMSRLEDFAVVDAPLLESVILLEQPAAGCDDASLAIKIPCAPNLRVLGYLDPRVHTLQIGGTVIGSGTMPSPSIVVPGLKILALRVNFRVFREVEMLASFLRCFPNIDTLHIESALQPSKIRHGLTGERHAELWQEASAVKCFRSQLKRMVFHKFRGHKNEFEFLKFIARDAHEMESLLLVPLQENSVSAVEVNEMIDKLGSPQFQAWASKVLLVSPKVDIAWNLQKASDLTIDNPFCY